MQRYPSYDPLNYPTGVEVFLNTFPPERRNEVRAAIVQLHFRRRAEIKWVEGQVQGMIELPQVLYKYVPANSLDHGIPRTLRATQPAALNDVMEGNVRTSMENKVNQDYWYSLIYEKLKEIFGDDALPYEELERRKRLYGDPRISTIVREYLSRFVGVVSFSSDPLIPPMWAHYARNSGFVIGYKTSIMRTLGVDLRRVLYLELAPVYHPTHDNIVRLQFVDEERRKEQAKTTSKNSGIPLLSRDVNFFELRKDWRELTKALFVKGKTWEGEQEIRLLVDLRNTRALDEKDENGYPISVIDISAEAIEEVYVGFNTPRTEVAKMEQVVGVGEGEWKLKRTDSHAYRMQVTSTSILNRRKFVDQSSA